MNPGNVLANIYTSVCFMFTVYIIIWLLLKYFANEDASTLNSKSFQDAPANVFPAITICLQSAKNNRGLYIKDVLSKHGFNQSDYWDMLVGIKSTDAGNGIPIAFENVTIKIENYLNKFRIQDTNDNQIITWKYTDFINAGGNSYPTVPMQVNYQDPNIICYSYHGKIDSDSTVQSIDFYFNLPKLKMIQKGLMAIYIHYNSQLIRNMRYLYKIRDFEGIEKNASNNQITFDLNSISLIRMRADANYPCDPMLENDDKNWMQRVCNLIGCIPPYWKVFHPDENPTVECFTSSQLKQAATYLPLNNEIAVKNVLQTYDPPCYRMRVFANTNSDRYNKEHMLKLKFRFRYPKYTIHINDNRH